MDKLSDDFLEKLNKQTDKTLNLTFSEEKRNIEGGFILKGKGIENNNSFESLIRMERDNIETKIAELLFQN